MVETLIALLFAHTVADFVLQPNWMVTRKRHPGVLLLHGSLVLLTAQITTGQFAALPLLTLALLHLMIDSVKTYGGFTGLTGFLIDQATHLVVLAGVALWSPSLWDTGLWTARLPDPMGAALPHLFTVGAGAILAIRAGGFAIQLLMQGHALSDKPEDNGLPGGGATIGHLERALIFLLVLAGQIAGIGFLVAAKSILRFGTISGDRKATEYVIIGTLFSFGWALLIALGTQSLLATLPPLEITAQWP
ncbi:hypothetical protein TG4357_02585 [Thalassovita gelatinovora]|uniref:DUF3307 domain-containing protein n=1 Tax=Thalassovita gelatinovora TaxID=53501 RepID=A0A0P1FF48_THAGE|nr:DUF3307 domain-containing protein [Thalassovita gelatinovora]QIZ79715.1 DUF3307 domain-containing protein [Thalassovita gelatinovora]CUH66697.1 hypothetical protein TG4357_02585 [Thalassovita gelatinovora]SEQ41178.1 Protein of unknown function [Thalassovita gelatinovora]